LRYAKGHKEAARKRIVSAAGKRLRRDGLEPVGIAELMKAAGLTHGGFYFHFDSKNDLIRAAVADSFGESNARNERLLKGKGLEALVRLYLSPRKRDTPEDSCVAAALAAEIARKSVAIRRPFMKELDRFIDLIGASLPSGDKATRRRTATGVFAVMMGVLQLARAEPNPARSREILDSGIEAALRLGRGPCDS
jgi:TetR/AcrR family transcriptional repressor of nem operon